MKCPKYIEKLIKRRADLAEALMSADAELVEWLDKNNIHVENYELHLLGGCEMYVNPRLSAQIVKDAIEQASVRK